MLILTRSPHEAICISKNIRIVVLGIKGYQVRIGIEAPPDIVVDREEVHLRKQAQMRKGHADGTGE